MEDLLVTLTQKLLLEAANDAFQLLQRPSGLANRNEPGKGLLSDKQERFQEKKCLDLTLQIRKAAASIPANAAEGWGRESTKEFIRFLRIAQGSLKELETHLILSHRIEYLTEATMQQMLNEAEKLGKMLRALIRRLERKI